MPPLSWRENWIATVLQGVPQMARLVPHLVPDLRVESLSELDPDGLLGRGVRGLIWDVDGTLMPPDGDTVAEESRPAVERLMSAPELRHVILSNAGGARQERLAATFPTIPILSAFAAGEGVAYRKRLGGEELWIGAGEDAERTLMPVRKPSLDLVRYALRELGVENPSAAAMIGDQHITDIAPANLLGARSILVRRCAPDRFERPVRWLQRFDAGLARAVSSVARPRDRW